MRFRLIPIVLALLASPVQAEPAAKPEPAARQKWADVRELVERAEDVLRGDTAEMTAAMTIVTPRWTRVVRFHSWDDRLQDRSFIRILEPKKDRGTGFLREKQTFWTYLPRVERSMRIPPSMMLQSWMGSDFTNDDLSRESSMIDDYDAELIGEKDIDGVLSVGVNLVPKETAPVVWARVEIWLDRESLSPVLYHYYDEPLEGKFELVRRLSFSGAKEVQGRPMPHAWLMEPLDKPGHTTRIDLENVRLDQKFDDGIFTQKNLRRSEGRR